MREVICCLKHNKKNFEIVQKYEIRSYSLIKIIAKIDSTLQVVEYNK
jgi:hypothetical protein